MVFSSSIHLPEKFVISFFITNKLHFNVCMYLIFSTHSPAEEYLGQFHFLTIVNEAGMNMAEQVCGK